MTSHLVVNKKAAVTFFFNHECDITFDNLFFFLSLSYNFKLLPHYQRLNVAFMRGSCVLACHRNEGRRENRARFPNQTKKMGGKHEAVINYD